MLKKLCGDFLKKSNENYALFEHLQQENIFIEWQAVAIFYSALCIAKAYLFSKGININSINSHDSIKEWLAKESFAKNKKVLYFYNNLYRHSRNARYLTNKTINKEVIKRMINDYETIKKLLIIDIDKL